MLQELYEQHKDLFSRSDHKIMEYLLRNKDQLPYLTVRDLVHTLQISPATVSRFWGKIDVRNLNDLKQRLHDLEQATPSSRMASAVKQIQCTGISEEDVLERQKQGIKRTWEHLEPQKLEKAARLMQQARRIYVLAPDASLGLFYILQYRLRRLGLEMILIKTVSELYEYLVSLTARDVLLIFSYSHIINEVKVLLRHCRSISCPAFVFTDLLLFTEEDKADFVFYTYRGEPNEYHSMTIPMLLLDILILCLTSMDTDSVSNSRYLEELRKTYETFIKR